MRFKHLARSVGRLFGTLPTGRTPPPGGTPSRGGTPPSDATAAADSIAALDSMPQQGLLEVALRGSDAAVRAAAIGRLEDGASVTALAGIRAGAPSVLPPALERLAQQRLSQLVDAGMIDFESVCASANLPALLFVAGGCGKPELLDRIIAALAEPELRARWVLDGATSRIRQAAARTIVDPDELRRLSRQLRGKDKSVYKILREKCDALNAEAQQLDRIRSEAAAACESLERHSHRIYDNLYEPTLRHFRTRWQAVAQQAAPEIRERASCAMQRCEDIVAAHHRRLAQEAAESAARAAREVAREQARRLVEAEAERLREAAAQEVAARAAQRDAEARAHAERAAAEGIVLREAAALIGKARAALRDGSTGRASGLRRALEEKLASLPVVPAPLARQVLALDATLSELKDWKEHAAAPKRAALVDDMQALIGAALEPRALADRIRRLQEEWTTVSKGVAGDADADWQRFREAAQSAYQPCGAYFEAQARRREANATARRSILERLRAFEGRHTGGEADFGEVAAVLREAPLEWRRHSPVERALGRTLQKEFDAIAGRLYGRLTAWRGQNADEKRAIITQAGQLLALVDAREAVDSVKRLQMRWKQIGAAAGEEEQGLWEEFRRHCDAVFQKRQQARAEHIASLQANVDRARILCEETEALAALAGAALMQEGAMSLAERRSAFDAIGELPREAERTLKGRFDRAVERLRAAVARQQSHAQAQARADLLEAARRIHAYTWAVRNAAPRVECDALKREAESYIAETSQLPHGAAEALADAWAGVEAEVRADSDVPLRLLCVRREILADLPTPPEDEALRREHRMGTLIERMGQGRAAAAEDDESLTLEWVRVGGVAPARYASLLERFRGHPEGTPRSGTGAT